jgi:dihydroxyacetone kinase-like predicted kinase
MAEALAHVRTGAVTEAARDDAGRPRFHRGDAVGFVEEELVAWGEPARDARGGARRTGARTPSS